MLILSGAKLAAGEVAGAQASPVANFFVAGNTTDRAGARVVAKDTDRDGRVDVTVNNGEGRLRTYLGKNFVGGSESAEFEDIDLSVVALSGTFVG